MGKIVKFIESNLLPLIRALNENTEEGEFTIGMEDNAPVGGEYYHVMDDEQDDIRENNIISENSTDRRVNSIIKKYSGVDDFNEIRAIRSKILKLIPNARAKNDMYLGAVAMWYLTGSLNNTSDRFKLNYLLGKLHQGASFGYGKILNEQDFGMVPFNTMKQIIDELIPSEETENSYKSGKKIQKVGNYTIYRMDSYDDTKYVRSQLSQVHWCIFEDDGTFSYMSEGYTVYVCVRDDYENARMMSYDELVEKLLSHGMANAAESLEENYPKDGMYDDFIFDIAYDGDETAELLFVDNEYELGLPPCDDYGLSMFVVMISNETYGNERNIAVYSRYNLPNMFDGGILSVSELSNVIGANAMSIFTPNGNVQEQETIMENLEFEVDSSEVDLSSFKKQDSLPSIWKDEDTLDSKVRLKLLDIADDFWEFVNVTWVEPKGIIITGSLCNYNWSDYSDVDLHLIVDFNEIGDREDFVRQYLDSKKNEWNEEHGALKIYGYPVELYVQNIDEDVSAGGIYDLEENKWIRKPSYDDIDEIDSESDEIKDEAARIMTIIDDMWSYFNKTNDNHKLELLGNDADNLWRKIKDMRKSSLEDGGEMSDGNIVYKYMRRKKYLDKLFDLRAAIYDKSNTITESMSLLGESDQSLDLFALAKERFGTTYDIRECGYILPDGSMLDFSGRSSMEKGADSSYLRGGRHVDHRDIYTIGWSEDGNTKNFDVEMDEFIRLGAIRTHVSSSYSLFNLFRKPTKKQADLMMRIIRYAGGCVDVEIGDGYESITSGEYDGANPRRVMSDIIRYFDEGINLMGNVDESITESAAYDKFREWQTFRYRIIGAMIKDGYLFHGTGSEFDEFESDRIRGEERGVYGYGAYFTNAAYKCEEYGNHFTILDSNGFNFLDIEEKVCPEYNIFKEKLGEFSKIEAGLDNARSNREYDYYNNLYDEYRSTVDTELLERFVSILEKNGATDYNTLNKLVDYSFTNSENKEIQKRISELYLSMGYDGFVCENQFVIFNFDKLNDNIVKDKEKLISKYSIDESKSTDSKLLTEWDRTDYFEKAKEYFGTTSDLNECGFILPDGEMLDLSSSKGRRGIPHRNVETIGIGLESFIEHGAIRCDSRYKLINICKRPTKEQIIRLVEIIKANNGSVSLDLGNGHVTFDYVDYKDTNYKRIINDIINFFDNKIKPSSLYESKDIINNNESVRNFLILLKENSLNEEVVADGNSEHNPYAKRWKAERDALKNFLKNFGKIMTSKENGKQYKVFQDQALSNLIGYNYCICIQWDPIKMEVGSTPYIRAFDKFTYRIFQAQFDDRGRDNLRGTSDDIGNSYQPIQTVR